MGKWDEQIKRKIEQNKRYETQFDSKDPYISQIRDFLIYSNNIAIDTMQQFDRGNKKRANSFWYKIKKFIGVIWK